MVSTVKERFAKVVTKLRFRQNKMPETTPFEATDNFPHRYSDPKVLHEALVKMGFKDEVIRIQVCIKARSGMGPLSCDVNLIDRQATESRGLDVMLPRKLTIVSYTIPEKDPRLTYY